MNAASLPAWSAPAGQRRRPAARALVVAAVADSPTRLHGALRSRDTELMAAALTALGARVDWADAALEIVPA
ncbi:3-phosphoshikimate 1-carboxyvinyltransferase, partial [Actinomyces sp. MRS3W]|nr:3-phosphoshikimate 1-carboxyvinyltransferase [Actinomyces sp. MRS3W]